KSLREISMRSIEEKGLSTGVDLLDFAGFEHRNYLVMFGNNREEMNLVSNMQQRLFEPAMKTPTDYSESDVVIPQLLAFIHYNFLYSVTSFMRGHVSGAFSALRSSLDAAFVAAYIIKDRTLYAAYIKRTHPFDKLNRN